MQPLYQQVFEIGQSAENLCDPKEPFAFHYFFHVFFPEAQPYLQGQAGLDETLGQIERLTRGFDERMERQVSRFRVTHAPAEAMLAGR